MNKILTIFLLATIWSCGPDLPPPSEDCWDIIEKREVQLTSKVCYNLRGINQITKDTANLCVEKSKFDSKNIGDEYCNPERDTYP